MGKLTGVILASTLTGCAALQKIIEYQHSIEEIYTYSVYAGDYVVYNDMYGCKVDFYPDYFRDYNPIKSRHPDSFFEQELREKYCFDQDTTQENNYKE